MYIHVGVFKSGYVHVHEHVCVCDRERGGNGTINRQPVSSCIVSRGKCGNYNERYSTASHPILTHYIKSIFIIYTIEYYTSGYTRQ